MSRSVNRPFVTIGALGIAIALGITHWPFLRYLQPLGDFYIGLLQICVLPFLLATIPLAVRSAMVGHTAGHVARALVTWLCVAIVIVSAVSVVLTSPSESTIASIGQMVGSSANRIDVEFALGGTHVAQTDSIPHGLLALIPTNIFAALTENDSLRVLVFAFIFGIGMVTSERSSGSSIFGALRHIHDVCLLIFDWFNLVMPIGVVALVAPQIALLGPDIYQVLSLFVLAFAAASFLILTGVVVCAAAALHVHPVVAMASLLRPIMMGAATRNTLVCIPLTIETMTEQLRVERGPCELYIPIGFAIFRFGTIVYFAVATLFMGMLVGRAFNLWDAVLVACFSFIASFATLGVTGLAALAPLATVLRPFGLSYELAVPLLVIIDPVANMVRVMLNVGVNCLIPALSAGREEPNAASALAPAE